MSKVTPDPPDADKAAPHQSQNPAKSDKATNHDIDDHHSSFTHIKTIPRTPCKMFTVNPEVDLQELLGFSSEALASACVIIMDKADLETGTVRNTLLGVHMIISDVEISVNRALDHLDPVE
ncbi:hypothetical protein NTD84_11855 [Pseudomonas sp. 14P_8.1_Bac3]|uniref:DUF6124 family protein n=1 Tax=Pseudomonas sp. 14P_8.1_Bac3 TaxID=2971621 RepID=UPI0021CA9987|nr:hypothetical protein [Pseudomonas sp. 14P_8.1_Bac3]MCU1760405.1 hypothetical protein [Pseudomonas sp. 14P_8.1_Bac3]